MKPIIAWDFKLVETILNATSEPERLALFTEEVAIGLRFPGSFSGDPALMLLAEWGLTPEEERDFATVKPFFRDYCERLSVLQKFADGLITGTPDKLLFRDWEQLNTLLSGAHLSAWAGSVYLVDQYPLKATSVAVALWTVLHGIGTFTLKRCLVCKRLMVDRSLGRKKYTCSPKCRSKWSRLYGDRLDTK